MFYNPTHFKTVTSLALVLLIALVLSFSLGAKSNSSQADFEYKVISQRVLNTEMLNQGELKYPEARAEVIEKTLNTLGKEGWELLEMNESLLILKRKLP